MVRMKTLMMTEIENIPICQPIYIQNWVKTELIEETNAKKMIGKKRRQRRLKKETKKAKKKTNRNGGLQN